MSAHGVVTSWLVFTHVYWRYCNATICDLGNVLVLWAGIDW